MSAIDPLLRPWLRLFENEKRILAPREYFTAIVCSIVTLAAGLEMSVTVEGVETREQFERLKSLGVNFVQGYLMGQPVPIDELERQPQVYRPRLDAAYRDSISLRRMVPLVAAHGAIGYAAFKMDRDQERLRHDCPRSSSSACTGRLE